MRQSKRRFGVTFAVVFTALLMTSCKSCDWPGTEPGTGTGSTVGSFSLTLKEAKATSTTEAQETVTIRWEGSGQMVEGTDTFLKDDPFIGFTNVPWQKSTTVTNVEAGKWTLWISVNSGPRLQCPSTIELQAGKTVNVVFETSPVDGAFTGCTTF